MTIEEWRKRYVGKLIHVSYKDELGYGGVGICTAILEGDEDDEVDVYFTNVDGEEESYYINVYNSRDEWWVESWEESMNA